MSNTIFKIGNVELGSMPRIALALDDARHEACAKKAKAEGVDILEVRIDQFKSVEINYVTNVLKAIKKIGLPIIATVRNVEEGGKTKLSDDQRLLLFDAVIPLVDAVDIELQSKTIINQVIQKAKNNKKIIIVSYHNFKNTPTSDKLEEMINQAKSMGGDIVKLATLATGREDIIKLINVTLKNKEKNLISILLGNEGVMSRVFFPLIGSLVTYACFSVPTSLGQLPLDFLKEELRLYSPRFNESLIKNLELIEAA